MLARPVRSCLVVLAIMLGPAAPALATIYIVPGSFPTIQAAIDAAVDGDEVLVLPGTFVESVELAKSMRVWSLGGAAHTAIQAPSGFYGAFVADDGASLEGFTLTSDTYGVYLLSGEVKRCTIEGCGYRGVLIANAISAALRECTIRDNPGGILVDTVDEAEITDCLVTDNHTTASGGGIATNYAFGRLRVERSSFIGNGGSSGGAILCYDESNVDVVDCLFDGNESSGPGGAIDVSGEFVIGCAITACTFRGNVAVAGGGIYSTAPADVTTVAASTFCGNDPDQIAGAWTDGGGNELLATCCPGDANADGDVGFDDLLAVLSVWGPCPGCPEDLDADGTVGFDDLLVILSAWGPCGG